jgi:HD superfamily phosphohydrolase YqeK
MNKSEFFEREILLIESEDLRDFVRFFFNERVGAWFWESGASASGKYHPKFAQGEGGLVRHTRAVAMVCEELLRMSTYAYMKSEYKDYARVACLLHDTRKYGRGDEEDKDCYKEHGAIAADDVYRAWHDFFTGGDRCPEFLTLAIKSHMGQWTENREDRPFTNIDRVVHLADYMASRSFFDIPQIVEEYNEDMERWYCEDTTCFDPEIVEALEDGYHIINDKVVPPLEKVFQKVWDFAPDGVHTFEPGRICWDEMEANP